MNRGFLGHHGPCHRGLHLSTVAHRCRPSSRTSQRLLHVCASATGDVASSVDAAAEQVPTTTAAAAATAAVASAADKKQRQLPDRFLTPPNLRRPGSNATALPSPAAEAINTAAAALLRVLGSALEREPQYVPEVEATAKAVAALLQPYPGFDWLVWQHKVGKIEDVPQPWPARQHSAFVSVHVKLNAMLLFLAVLGKRDGL